jgi:hypothetical protein
LKLASGDIKATQLPISGFLCGFDTQGGVVSGVLKKTFETLSVNNPSAFLLLQDLSVFGNSFSRDELSKLPESLDS